MVMLDELNSQFANIYGPAIFARVLRDDVQRLLRQIVVCPGFKHRSKGKPRSYRVGESDLVPSLNTQRFDCVSCRGIHSTCGDTPNWVVLVSPRPDFRRGVEPQLACGCERYRVRGVPQFNQAAEPISFRNVVFGEAVPLVVAVDKRHHAVSKHFQHIRAPGKRCAKFQRFRQYVDWGFVALAAIERACVTVAQTPDDELLDRSVPDEVVDALREKFLFAEGSRRRLWF